MNTLALKISIIDKIIKTNDESTLLKIESLFSRNKKEKINIKTIHDFLSAISKKEGIEMINAINLI